MEFLKRLIKTVLFIPLLFFSLLEMIYYVIIWFNTGANVYDKDLLFEKLLDW